MIASTCFLALALSAVQDGQPRLTLSSGVVKLGGEVAYEIVVENARTARIVTVPSVDGLAVEPPRGPSRETHSSLINGHFSRRDLLRWSGTLRASRTGDFVVPPFEVEVDGQRRTTRSVRLSVVEDLRGEELGWFEVHPSATRLYEGEPLELRLDFGWDRSIEGQLDWANLVLPWWGELSGWVEVESEARRLNRNTLQLALNRDDSIAAEIVGTVQRDNREFAHLRVARTFLPTRPGKVHLPASFLEFRRVTRRARSLFERDQTERFYVRGTDVDLEVLPLPEEGRPYDFSGAVGSIEAAADVDRRDVDAGDSIKLTVEWSGHGNFEFFDPPDLSRDERFSDFRVYGSTQTKASDRRTVVYDLAPVRGGVRSIPSVRLSFFDTQAERYAVAETEPIPIRVRALENAEGLAPLPDGASLERDVRDIVAGHPRPRGPHRPGGGWVVGGLFGLPLVWLGLRTAVRRRGEPGAPAERRRRAARRRLRRDLRGAQRASQQLAALDEFLAARTREPAEAWSGRDARAWSAATGALEGQALADLVSLRDELAAEAWGGGDRPLDLGRILSVAEGVLEAGL